MSDDSRDEQGQIVMPFYIVFDVSGSMAADMAALNDGVRQLRQDIMSDPVIDDLVMLSIITFDTTARTVTPLNFPTAITPPTLQPGGSTNYAAAFQEFHRAFEADRARLKGEGKKVFRPCVFFLSDGDPNGPDYKPVFQQLFGYDPATKQGNAAYPYITPFGFRDATEATMKSIAYPTFGEKIGRYFLARQGEKVGQLVKAMLGVIGQSVIKSGQSVGTGKPQYVPPAANQVPGTTSGLADSFV